MRRVKFLLTAVLAIASFCVMAQDLSGDAYAMWGETVEEREANILRSQFLKEAIQNKNYNEAAEHFQYLVAHAPKAAESIYQRGELIYANKFSRATTRPEQVAAFDSMMIVLDLRLMHFGTTDFAKAEILDRRARQYVTYNKRDREGIRNAFKDALAAQIVAGSADLYELGVIYMQNLAEDYKNDDIYADVVISEYDRLAPYYDKAPADKQQYADQLATVFGMSGVATCENLEALFAKKLEANPEDLTVLNQAVALMSRAKCTSDFFFEVTERKYKLDPSANTAIFLAQGLQDKGEFEKAVYYLREALKTETDSDARIGLLKQLGVVELAASNISGAMQAARELREFDENNAYSYFIIANCYSSSGCVEAFWAAYDMMKKAEELFEEGSEKEQARQMASAYASRWPLSNDERFFMEGIKAGTVITVPCGAAAGVRTTVRFR